MLATAMLAGCQDAPIPGDNTENYFSFSAGVAKTRTEAIVEDDGLTFRWTDRDEVGIYGIQDDRSLGDNYAYTAYPDSEDAANCVFRFSTYGQAYQNVAAGSEFYAYYPYDPAANESTPGALPIVLPAGPGMRSPASRRSSKDSSIRRTSAAVGNGTPLLASAMERIKLPGRSCG